MTDDLPRNERSGSLSVIALLLIFFLSAVISGGILIVTNVVRMTRSDSREADLVLRADELSKTIVARFADDETPESDGPSLFLKELALPENGSVSIEDISSRINPNAIRKQILEETSLSPLLLEDASADRLQQIRFDAGPAIDIESRYESVLDIAGSPELFTAYGLFNVNTTDEFVLETLVEHRTHDASFARDFRMDVQDALARRRIIDAYTLSSFFGEHEEVLWPIITSAPIWNIHFAPEQILGAILAYEPFGISSVPSIVDEIVTLRRDTEIAPEELFQLLGVEPTHRISQFVGTQTWFWRVRIELSGLTANYTIFATPNEAPFSEKRSYLIIERVLEYNGTGA